MYYQQHPLTRNSEIAATLIIRLIGSPIWPIPNWDYASPEGYPPNGPILGMTSP
jgi:hypothetical protein